MVKEAKFVRKQAEKANEVTCKARILPVKMLQGVEAPSCSSRRFLLIGVVTHGRPV
jgi:hypothetical protein